MLNDKYIIQINKQESILLSANGELICCTQVQDRYLSVYTRFHNGNAALDRSISSKHRSDKKKNWSQDWFHK